MAATDEYSVDYGGVRVLLEVDVHFHIKRRMYKLLFSEKTFFSSFKSNCKNSGATPGKMNSDHIALIDIQEC